MIGLQGGTDWSWSALVIKAKTMVISMLKVKTCAFMVFGVS